MVVAQAMEGAGGAMVAIQVMATMEGGLEDMITTTTEETLEVLFQHVVHASHPKPN